MTALSPERRALILSGWNGPMAEALAENGHTPETAAQLDAETAMALFLEWNGIIGWTRRIIDCVHNCENMEAL